MEFPKPLMSYEEALKEVDGLADKLGHKIEEKINPLVAALRMYGIVTSASCQGHGGCGLRYPWIDVEMESIPLASRVVCAANSARHWWVFEPRPTFMRLHPGNIRVKLSRMQHQALVFAERIRKLND
ncbi:MAG: hypothetical protein JWL87_374 [Candidatus Adlerbacteria bacterium]|nr:hypothetical protein [Candidatus Adlerbacteria bacterium]